MEKKIKIYFYLLRMILMMLNHYFILIKYNHFPKTIKKFFTIVQKGKTLNIIGDINSL